MAGFKASAAISKMTYDFSGIAVDDEDVQAILDGPEGKGTTPEPSGPQVRHFQAEQRKVLGLAADTPQEDVNKHMLSLSEDEFIDLDDDILNIVADVTGGKPSRQALEALPFRVRESYYGYIIGELTNFLAGPGTTRR